VTVDKLFWDEFTCALCGGIFPKDRNEDEVIAELHKYFGDVPIEECDLVCDACWEKIKPIEEK
jgi:hypothetical protein